MTAAVSPQPAPSVHGTAVPDEGRKASAFSEKLSRALLAGARDRVERQVYVIDDFMRPVAGLEGLTPGSLVSGVLKADGLRPNELHWGEQGGSGLSLAKVAEDIERIMASHKGAEKNVYVNLNFGNDAGTLTPRTTGWNAFVDAVKRGVASGITFVVPGGNTSFNPLATIEGVITAGAQPTARASSRTRFFDNPETDARADPRLEVGFLRSGLDFDRDGRPDAPLPPGVRPMVGRGILMEGTEVSAARITAEMALRGVRYGDHVAPFRRP